MARGFNNGPRGPHPHNPHFLRSHNRPHSTPLYAPNISQLEWEHMRENPPPQFNRGFGARNATPFRRGFGARNVTPTRRGVGGRDEPRVNANFKSTRAESTRVGDSNSISTVSDSEVLDQGLGLASPVSTSIENIPNIANTTVTVSESVVRVPSTKVPSFLDKYPPPQATSSMDAVLNKLDDLAAEFLDVSTNETESVATTSSSASVFRLGADAAVNAASGDDRRTSSNTTKDTNPVSGACGGVSSGVHASKPSVVANSTASFLGPFGQTRNSWINQIAKPSKVTTTTTTTRIPHTYDLNLALQMHNNARSTQSRASLTTQTSTVSSRLNPVSSAGISVEPSRSSSRNPGYLGARNKNSREESSGSRAVNFEPEINRVPEIDYDRIVSSVVDRLRPILEEPRPVPRHTIYEGSPDRSLADHQRRRDNIPRLTNGYSSGGGYSSGQSSTSSRRSHRSGGSGLGSHSHSSDRYSRRSRTSHNSEHRDADHSDSSSASVQSRSSESRRRRQTRSSGAQELSSAERTILQQHGFTRADLAARVNHVSGGIRASALPSMPASQFLISVSPDSIREFSGKMEDYEQFRSEFMAFAETVPEHQWLHKLRDKLPAGARNLISRCHGIGRAAFDQAITILDNNYNKVEAIIQILIAQIEDSLNPNISSDSVKFAAMVAEVRGKLDRIFHLDPVEALALNGCLPKMMSCLPRKPYEAACLLRLNKPRKYNFSTVLRLAEDHVRLLESQRVGPENRVRSESHSSRDSVREHRDGDRRSHSYKSPSRSHVNSTSADVVPVGEQSDVSVNLTFSDNDTASQKPSKFVNRSRTPEKSRQIKDRSEYRGRSLSRSRTRLPTFKCNLCKLDDHDTINCKRTFTEAELQALVSDRFICLACGGLNHKSSRCSVALLCPNADFLCSGVESKCKSIPHSKRFCAVVKENI